MDTLQQRTEELRPRIDALCQALRGAAAELFGDVAIAGCTPAAALYRLERDPASGHDSLLGEWQDSNGHRIGMFVFHGDGSCFGEYDIVRAHPRDARWFVEAVEAWASAPDGPDQGAVCAELRLLAALE